MEAEKTPTISSTCSKHLYSGASVCPFPQEIESIEKDMRNAVSLAPSRSLHPILSYYTCDRGESWLTSFGYTYSFLIPFNFNLTDTNKILDYQSNIYEKNNTSIGKRKRTKETKFSAHVVA